MWKIDPAEEVQFENHLFICQSLNEVFLPLQKSALAPTKFQ